MTLRHKIGLTFVLVALATGPNADTDAEREALAQLIHELQSLELIITRAEREADSQARIKFRYDWLRKDLETVIDGIEDHLDTPSLVDSEAFPVLRGDYRR